MNFCIGDIFPMTFLNRNAMKRYLFLLLFSLSGITLFSQNLQLHYNVSDGRKYLTSIVELFRPDRHGTFTC